MLNKNALIILLHAKEKDKWVPVASLRRVGIMPRHIESLEDKGILVSKVTPQIGKTVTLTLQGYKEAQEKMTNSEEI